MHVMSMTMQGPTLDVTATMAAVFPRVSVSGPGPRSRGLRQRCAYHRAKIPVRPSRS